MRIENLETLRELKTPDLTKRVQQLNWFARLRVQYGRTGAPYWQYQVLKVRGWEAVAVGPAADDADRIVRGFSCSNSRGLFALVFPFYLSDGSMLGYEAPVSISGVREFEGAWAPFDYAILGGGEDESVPTGLILVNYDDFAIYVGPRSFIRGCFREPDRERAQFAHYASLDASRSDLKSVSDEMLRYGDLEEDCSIMFPKL